MTTMLKLRSTVFGAIHSYFRDQDFIEYQAPNFVAGAVEGGSTLFEVPYFGRKAYLTQSWQLYAEVNASIGTIIPLHHHSEQRNQGQDVTFTEFWHAEMEVAWADNQEIMNYGEGVVRKLLQLYLKIG